MNNEEHLINLYDRPNSQDPSYTVLTTYIKIGWLYQINKKEQTKWYAHPIETIAAPPWHSYRSLVFTGFDPEIIVMILSIYDETRFTVLVGQEMFMIDTYAHAYRIKSITPVTD